MRYILTLITALLLAPLAALDADEGQTITNSIGMTLVPIEPGVFTMGQDGPPVSGDGQDGNASRGVSFGGLG